MKRLVVATALTFLIRPAQGLEGPLAATMQGASCIASVPGRLTCHYKLPDDTSFDIEGVGKDARIILSRADGRGDYRISFDTPSLCVMVSYGRKGYETFLKIIGGSEGLNKLAFVSPRTGRVHEYAEECKRG